MFRKFLCLATLTCACQRQPPPAAPRPPPVAPQPQSAQAEPWLTEGAPPLAETPLPEVVAHILRIAATGSTKDLAPLLSETARRRMAPGVGSAGSLPILAGTVTKRLRGPIEKIVYQGGRASVLVRHGKQLDATYFYLDQGRWTYDPIDMTQYSEPRPGPVEAPNRLVTLAEATAGLPGAPTGTLVAVLDTTAGTIHCVLHDKQAPKTVANFVGLARGLRGIASVQDGGLTAPLEKKPLYQNIPFYRTVSGLLAETGDPVARGTGPAGYQIADELDLRLRHDKPGVLAMASRGPNTSSSAFYLTAKPAPGMDDRHTIFGLCDDQAVIEAVTRAPVGTIVLKTVQILRK